jgi:hypothetical protein
VTGALIDPHDRLAGTGGQAEHLARRRAQPRLLDVDPLIRLDLEVVAVLLGRDADETTSSSLAAPPNPKPTTGSNARSCTSLNLAIAFDLPLSVCRRLRRPADPDIGHRNCESHRS